MNRPGYPSLFWSYLRIGASAFGGGLAALPVFEAEMTDRRHWLTPAEVAEAYAISQSVPGVIIVNFAVFSALRIAGRRAALLAVFAVVLPAFLIILLLAAFFGSRWENRWVAGILSGLRPAVVALIAAATLRLGRRSLRSPVLVLAAAACAALLLGRIIGPVPLILLGAGAGLTLHAGHSCRRRAP
ncbi:MAG: chromate transporter [Lentisphaerae bacterium]|nr:chromate transporter [Lentisphaerota bacterium]